MPPNHLTRPADDGRQHAALFGFASWAIDIGTCRQDFDVKLQDSNWKSVHMKPAFRAHRRDCPDAS